MSTTDPTPISEMTPTGRIPNLEAQLITQAIQDPAFRQRLVENPKAVLAEHGLQVPDDVQITVLQESSTQYYLVLPALELPAESGEVTEVLDEELEAVAGGALVATQNRNWTGCASGQSGCIATTGCASSAGTPATTPAPTSFTAFGAVQPSGFGMFGPVYKSSPPSPEAIQACSG